MRPVLSPRRHARRRGGAASPQLPGRGHGGRRRQCRGGRLVRPGRSARHRRGACCPHVVDDAVARDILHQRLGYVADELVDRLEATALAHGHHLPVRPQLHEPSHVGAEAVDAGLDAHDGATEARLVQRLAQLLLHGEHCLWGQADLDGLGILGILGEGRAWWALALHVLGHGAQRPALRGRPQKRQLQLLEIALRKLLGVLVLNHLQRIHMRGSQWPVWGCRKPFRASGASGPEAGEARAAQQLGRLLGVVGAEAWGLQAQASEARRCA
mmetsp:Transcript_35253/g.94461  ORF Transcript_35253/g.94461 Transcript_35253/m.94461 type:complete len:270 (+) Transcript_35253:223-1032(+)